jgi:hypothetical protein
VSTTARFRRLFLQKPLERPFMELATEMFSGRMGGNVVIS